MSYEDFMQNWGKVVMVHISYGSYCSIEDGEVKLKLSNKYKNNQYINLSRFVVYHGMRHRLIVNGKKVIRILNF